MNRFDTEKKKRCRSYGPMAASCCNGRRADFLLRCGVRGCRRYQAAGKEESGACAGACGNPVLFAGRGLSGQPGISEGALRDPLAGRRVPGGFRVDRQQPSAGYYSDTEGLGKIVLSEKMLFF